MSRILLIFALFFFTLCHLECYDVLCIGGSIVDYSIPVQEEWLAQVDVEKGGVKTVSSLDFDAYLMSLKANQKTSPPTIRVGGSAGNVVKGLGQLGCSSAFLSRSGNDENGYFVRSVLQSNHVQVVGSMYPGITAKVMCCITPDGQRTFLFCGGDHGILTINDIQEKAIQNTSYVHIEGYALRNREFLDKIIQLAQKNKCKISFDLSSFVLARENREYLIKAILPNLDILFGNFDEMRALFGDELAIKSSLKSLKCLSVMTLGENGCKVFSKKQHFHSPVQSVRVVDTTGAGDLFISGFLYGKIQGKSLEQCAALGNRLGSTIATILGPELPLDQWKQIKQSPLN